MKRVVLCSVLVLAQLLGTLTSVSAEPAPKPGAKPAATAKGQVAKPNQAPGRKLDNGKPAPGKPGPKNKPAALTKDNKGKPGVNEAVRRSIAGSPTNEESAQKAESTELKQLREVEKEIFQAAAPAPGGAWPSDKSSIPSLSPGRPTVHLGGLTTPLATPPSGEQKDAREGDSRAWMKSLKSPDFPVKWDERVVRYLEFLKDDPRGKSLMALGYKRSGRYGSSIEKALKAEGVPKDLIWLAMAESMFEPAVKSHAGAAGLWQFMPEGAKIYGMRVERWVDDRLDPVAATVGAAKYLSDLHKRFGSWELAMAAYNMGFGGVLSAVKKYNTNDFWELSRIEAGIPWETTMYVPKIMAFAIAANNPSVFGLDGLTKENTIAFDTVEVQPAVSLQKLAQAAGVSTSELEALNPQYKAGRTPPSLGNTNTLSAVKVPQGKAAALEGKLTSLTVNDPKLGTYKVKFGETIDAIAHSHGVSKAKIQELNGMHREDYPRAGDVLLVPINDQAPASLGNEMPVVVVPTSPSSIAGKTRVFYRVVPGDTLKAVAHAFEVNEEDLRTWNTLEPTARLQEGMSLQVFVAPNQDLSKVVALREKEVRILTKGTTEFFEHFEAQKGRKRIIVTVGDQDTWQTIARKYRASVGLLERINRKGRNEPLTPGDKLVVYTPMQDNAASGNVLASKQQTTQQGVSKALPSGVKAGAQDNTPALPTNTTPNTDETDAP